jgi:hypothetical protein
VRIARVRSTDYRPGATDPLSATAATLAGEKNEHDRAVAEYSPETLQAAAADLGRRHYHDRRDPEHRWGMARLAALARAMAARHLLA